MRRASSRLRHRLAAAGIALLALGGCARGYRADFMPPPRRVEVYMRAPSPGFVWVSGYWNRGGGEYYWVPGRWQQPPRGRAYWVQDRWERRGHKWHRVRGYWR